MNRETKTMQKLCNLVSAIFVAFALLTTFIPSSASGQQVVYTEDFSSDPGYTLYYVPVAGEFIGWDSTGEYYRLRILEYDGASKFAYSPSFYEIADASFVITIDLNLIETSFGFPMGLFFGEAHVENQSVSINYQGSHDPRWAIQDNQGNTYYAGGLDLNVWYRFTIDCNNESGTADLSILDINADTAVYTNLGVPFTPNAFNGVGLGYRTGNWDGTVGEILYDNISVTSNASWLIIPSFPVSPCDDVCIVQPVNVSLTEPIKGASVPIAIPAGVEICSLSTYGLYTENWDIFADTVNVDSGYILVGLANFQGLTIPVGTTTIFDIYYTTDRSCQISEYIHWDTALSADVLRQLKFSDTANQVIHPGFDVMRDSTEIVGYTPGDFNNSGGVDVSDLGGIVDYLFRGGPPPCYAEAMDCNGDGTGPDIADLTYLVDYLFRGGAAPLCFGAASPSAKVSTAVSAWSEYDGQTTTIYVNNAVSLRGLEVVLDGDGGASPINKVGQFSLFHHSEVEGLKLGLLDMKGIQTLKAGEHAVISIDGEHQIVSVIASDLNHTRHVANLDGSAKLETLPGKFALAQNYPNPFNPTTNLSFTLPHKSDYELTIFNVNGQKVRKFSGNANAGTVDLRWDASENASGIYFYKLTAGSFTATKKMILLK